MRVDFARAQLAGFKAVKSARYLPRQPHVILNEVKNLLNGGKKMNVPFSWFNRCMEGCRLRWEEGLNRCVECYEHCHVG